MVSYVPTRYLSHGRRVYKSDAGKFFNRTDGGYRTYRPKVSHITKGVSKYTVKPHNNVYHGGKPVAKYQKNAGPRRISSAYTLMSRIMSRRSM